MATKYRVFQEGSQWVIESYDDLPGEDWPDRAGFDTWEEAYAEAQRCAGLGE